MSREFRWTPARLKTLRMGLDHGYVERQSFADAWAKGTPERKAAEDQAERISKLYREIFGEPTAEERFAAKMADAPRANITDLMSNSGKREFGK